MSEAFRDYNFQSGMLLIIKFYFTLLKLVSCQFIVTSYLVYSVKINQLASKYSWLSVLQYDEDYHINQTNIHFR